MLSSTPFLNIYNRARVNYNGFPAVAVSSAQYALLRYPLELIVSISSFSFLGLMQYLLEHLYTVLIPRKINNIVVVMIIRATAGRAAISLYGVGRVVFNTTKAMLAFCIAVSRDTATICGRLSRATQAKNAPNKKPDAVTANPAANKIQSMRTVMCDML